MTLFSPSLLGLISTKISRYSFKIVKVWFIIQRRSTFSKQVINFVCIFGKKNRLKNKTTVITLKSIKSLFWGVSCCIVFTYGLNCVIKYLTLKLSSRWHWWHHLAILPYYFGFVLEGMKDTLVVGRVGKVLRLVRVMRILRVFKVSQILIQMKQNIWTGDFQGI